jgi:hypothetical protein
LQRFAPSLNGQQALAVDNILSADSWVLRNSPMNSVGRGMANRPELRAWSE